MTTYEPLAEVRKTLKVKWYRTKIDRQVMKERCRNAAMHRDGFRQVDMLLSIY